MRGLLWFSENLSFFSDGSEGDVLSPKQSLERSGLCRITLDAGLCYSG